MLELKLAERHGLGIYGRGAGSLAELAAGPPPSRGIRGWVSRVAEKVRRDDDPPSVY